MSQIQQAGTPVNTTDTATVSKVSGSLLGFYVNSTSSGTLVFRQGAAGASSGAAISGTITPAIGFHAFPAYCVDGCHVTVGSTINVTIFYAAG